MRFRYTVSLCAAALIPHFASARTPTAIAQEIGVVDAVVDFCSKVDPTDKDQFERKGKQVLPKMSEDSLERARRSADYHAAYVSMQSVLQGLSKPDAVRDCAATR